MTPRGNWLRAFLDDPVALWAVRQAAEVCMRQVCDRHELGECDCAEQMMTPLEFVDWIELEVNRRRHEPVRLDQRENRQAGQYRRNTAEMVASR